MNKQNIKYEKLLFLYSCALEDGDFAIIQDILAQAEQDAELTAQLREIEAIYETDLQLPRARVTYIPLPENRPISTNGHQENVLPAPQAMPTIQTKYRGKNMMRIAILIIILFGSLFTYLGTYNSDSPVVVTEIPAGQSATLLPQAERLPITVENADQLEVLANYGATYNDSGAAWSNDGSQILVYGTRGILVYDAETYTEIEIIPFDGQIHQLVVHPDKPQVAFTYDKNHLAILDLTTKEIMADVEMIDKWIQNLDYSPNGDYLVTAYWHHDLTYLWDSQTAEIQMILRSTNQDASGATFSPDSRYLAVYGNITKYNLVNSNDNDIPFIEIIPGVVIWDVELGVQVGRLYGILENLSSLTYSADGQSIIGTDNRGFIYVWDVAEILAERIGMQRSLSAGYHEATVIEGSQNDFWTRRFGHWQNTDNAFITYRNTPTLQIEVWDIEKMEFMSAKTFSINISQRWFRGFIPSPNEQVVALETAHNLVIFNWQSDEIMGEIPLNYNYWSDLSFSDDSSAIAVNNRDKIAVWDIETGTEINRFEDDSEQGSTLSSARFMPESANLMLIGGNAFIGDGIVRWDILTDETTRITTTNLSRTISLDINSANEMLFIDDNGNLRRLGQDTHNEEQNIWLVNELHVSSDYFIDDPEAFWLGSDRVIFKDNRKVMYVADNETGNILTELVGHVDTITDITLSSDESILASVDYAGTLILWDTTTWEQITKVYDIAEHPYAVTIASDNRLLAIGADGQIILWDSETQTTVSVIEETGGAVEFSPDGTLLATFQDNGVALWGIPQ